MRTHEAIVVAALVAAMCGPACGSHAPPKSWRPPAAVAQYNERGGWIVVECAGDSRGDASSRVVQGELIAVEHDTIHVLTLAGVESVPASSVRQVRLVAYGTPAGALAGWAVAGGLSTLSHGGFLLFTAPTWAVGGIIASTREAHAGTLHEAVARFARFPQGLPAGVDIRSLGTLTAPVTRER